MSWYRTPNTTQEARDSLSRYDNDMYEFGPIKFRSKRNNGRMVNAWDDCDVAAVRDRGWKRQTKRERQWKPTSAPRPEKKQSKFRGHSSWCYPKWKQHREYVTEYVNRWGLNPETNKYQKYWHNRTYWKWIIGEFLGYRLVSCGPRWSAYLGAKKRKLYTLEEITKRGWHIR